MNLAAYQEWKATYWASDPDGVNTAELLHMLFSMDERIAFISQYKYLAGSLKANIETYATLGSKPMNTANAADDTALSAAYETLRIAFKEAVKGNIGGVVAYVDGLIHTARKDKEQ